jgi:hypothetical protein
MAEVKPECNLIFDHTFVGGAAQTTTMTVLGEETTSTVTPDEVIQVNITVAELNGLLTVGAQSASGVGYPQVTLNLSGVRAKLNSTYDQFVLVETDSTGVQFADGNGDQCDSLQKVFSGRSFTFDGASPLASIPIEAVKSVEYDGPLTVTNSANQNVLTTKLVSDSADVEEGLLKRIIVAGTDSSLSDTKEAAVRSLYLQALAADRYQQATSPATGTQPTSQSSSGGWNFQENDTLTFYTDLSLVKTRAFIPDPDSFVGGTPGDRKFAIDGSNVVIGDGDVTDDKYDSSVLPHIVAWKLKVVTPPA